MAQVVNKLNTSPDISLITKGSSKFTVPKLDEFNMSSMGSSSCPSVKFDINGYFKKLKEININGA